MITVSYSQTFKIGLLFLIAFAIACSGDDPVAVDNETDPTGMTPDPNPSPDPDPIPDPNPANNESIAFEENFVLDKDRGVINYVVSPELYNLFLDDATSTDQFDEVTRKLYEHVEDDYDFVIILSAEEEKPDGLYFGITRYVQSDIAGLGGNLYDNTAFFGSQGRLKTVIHMPKLDFIQSGPFLHEIVHYWGNKGFIPSTVGGHWGYASVGGQLGGFDTLEDLGNNTYQGTVGNRASFGAFANGGNSVPYGSMELYLMGLIDIADLAPVKVAENPVNQGSGKFTADAITTYTGQQLLAQNGARVPAFPNTQKEFTAVVIVLSTAQLSEAQLATVNSDIKNFSTKGAPDSSWNGLYNFWTATGGRASFDITVANESIK